MASSSIAQCTISSPNPARRDAAISFAALIERYERPIFGFIYELMDRNAADAADLTQETFIKAYFALGRTSDDLNAGAWLHRIARNCCYDALRRRRSIRWQPCDAVVRMVADDSETDPERIILRREMEEGVRDVLARMSPRNRRALVLRVYDGLSFREVGAALGITDEAARSQLSRARAQFRRLAGQHTRNVQAGEREDHAASSLHVL